MQASKNVRQPKHTSRKGDSNTYYDESKNMTCNYGLVILTQIEKQVQEKYRNALLTGRQIPVTQTNFLSHENILVRVMLHTNSCERG